MAEDAARERRELKELKIEGGIRNEREDKVKINEELRKKKPAGKNV